MDIKFENLAKIDEILELLKEQQTIPPRNVELDATGAEFSEEKVFE